MTNSMDHRANRTFGRMSWRAPSMNNSDRTTKGTPNDLPYREDITDKGDMGELTVRTNKGTPDEIAEHIQEVVAQICKRAQQLLMFGIPAAIIEAALNDSCGAWGVWSVIEEEDEGGNVTVKIQCRGHDFEE